MGSEASKTVEPILSKISIQNHKRMTDQMLKKQKPQFKQLAKNEQLGSIYRGLFQRYRVQFISAGTIQSEFAENAPFAVSWNSTIINKETLYTQAQNILNLTLCYRSLRSPSSRVYLILQDLSLRLLEGYQKMLMDLKPDLIFQGWGKIYASNNDKSKQAFFQQLSVRSVFTILEKYGMKLAAQLFSEQVASGKVYGGKSPLQCEYTDILRHLLLAAIAIIEKDLQVQEYQEKNFKK